MSFVIELRCERVVREWAVAPYLRALLAGLILIAPAVLPALAYASPPDPSWILGIYDDADHDDVVVLATSGTGQPAHRPAADPQTIPPLPEKPPQSIETAVLTLSPSPVRPRAPPTSEPALFTIASSASYTPPHPDPLPLRGRGHRIHSLSLFDQEGRGEGGCLFANNPG